MFKECSVAKPHCSRTSCFFYRFPDPHLYPVDFQLWVKRTGNNQLFDLTEQQIHLEGKLCSEHFEKECFKNRYALHPGALPTLCIPEITFVVQETSTAQAHPKESNKAISGISEQPEEIQMQVDNLNGPATSSNGKEVNNENRNEQEIIIVTRSHDEASVGEQLENLKALQAKFVIKRKCGICLELKEAKGLIQIESEKAIYKEYTVRDVLELVVPEFNLKRYRKSEICSECKNLLVASFQLKEIWKETYNKLQEVENKESEYLASQPSIVISDNESDYEVPSESDDAQETIDTVPIDPQLTLLREPTFNTVTYFDHDYTDLNGVSVKVRIKSRKGKDGGVCEFCGVHFSNCKRMNRHISREHVTLVCEQCGEVNEGFTALAKHRRIAHKVKYKPKQKAEKVVHKCDICLKKFSSKTSLKWHVLAHYNIRRQLQCHTCGKTLGNAQSLRVHLRRHMVRLKNVACDQCDKTFYGKPELSKHMKSHSNVFHVCHICGRKMKHAHALRRHVKVFHLLMDTVCEICDRPYYKKYDLLKHKVREHGWHPTQNEDIQSQREISKEDAQGISMEALRDELNIPEEALQNELDILEKDVQAPKDILHEAVSHIMEEGEAERQT